MVRATEAKVEWNASKKQWQVILQVGAEVIRRTCPKSLHDARDEDLRDLAIQTAKDEGYDIDGSHVLIAR
jgi:hypothetical protein